MRRTIALSLIVLLALGSVRAAGSALQPGLWRAWLDCQGRELPFGLELVQSADGMQVWIVNGDERIEVPKVYWENGEIVFDIDYYDAGLRGTPDEGGTHLYGSWWRRIGAEAVARVPFEAEFMAGGAGSLRGSDGDVNGHGSAASGATAWTAATISYAPVDDREVANKFVGRWAVQFAARVDSSVGIFSLAKDGMMRGTFLHTTGDYRSLAGTVREGRLQLSRFDGAHAFLFEASLTGEGTIRGDFWEGNYHHDSWSGRADMRAHMPDSFGHFQWKGGLDLQRPTFVGLDGNRHSLAEVAPAAKAVVLEIFGTWCPNCHDSMAYLSELQRRYGKQGLAVIGLAFEMTPDFQRNARQVNLYNERFGVEYPILLAARDAAVSPGETFPNIQGVYGIPTIIFLRADGSVRAVHTGFVGPAGGKDHEAMRAEIEALVHELLK